MNDELYLPLEESFLVTSHLCNTRSLKPGAIVVATFYLAVGYAAPFAKTEVGAAAKVISLLVTPESTAWQGRTIFLPSLYMTVTESGMWHESTWHRVGPLCPNWESQAAEALRKWAREMTVDLRPAKDRTSKKFTKLAYFPNGYPSVYTHFGLEFTGRNKDQLVLKLPPKQ
jgi:hypothetical protein